MKTTTPAEVEYDSTSADMGAPHIVYVLQSRRNRAAAGGSYWRDVAIGAVYDTQQEAVCEGERRCGINPDSALRVIMRSFTEASRCGC